MSTITVRTAIRMTSSLCELQTKNAMEIMCGFQKSNSGDLQLRSWRKRRQQDYKADRKNLEGRKTKAYFNKPSKWLKRLIVRDQENVFLSGFGLIVPAVLKCLF